MDREIIKLTELADIENMHDLTEEGDECLIMGKLYTVIKSEDDSSLSRGRRTRLICQREDAKFFEYSYRYTSSGDLIPSLSLKEVFQELIITTIYV